MRFSSLALRAVSVAAAAAVLVQLIGCSDKKTIIDEDVLSVNSFLPDYSLVKPLGRTHVTDSGLWLAYSGSGAEFSFNGNRLSVTMSGDDYIDSEDFDSFPESQYSLTAKEPWTPCLTTLLRSLPFLTRVSRQSIQLE